MKKIAALVLALSVSAISLVADAAPRHGAAKKMHAAKTVPGKAATQQPALKKKQPMHAMHSTQSMHKGAAPKAHAQSAKPGKAGKAAKLNKNAKPLKAKPGHAAKAQRAHRLH